MLSNPIDFDRFETNKYCMKLAEATIYQ